jgi:hypothetical protein
VGFSDLFTFPIQSASIVLPKKVLFILDPREISQYLSVCHGVGTNLGAHPVCPSSFLSPYVLSSVSSRAVFCLVGVRRAVPGCSLKMIRILFVYAP